MTVQKAPIRGPFHGIITSVPPATDDQGFEGVLNFIGYERRLRTRPGLILPGFAPPGGELPLNMGSFEDAEGGLHTFLLTDRNAYMLMPGPALHALTYPLFIVSAALNNAGTGYTVDDILHLNQGTATNGTILVTSVDLSGVILTFQLEDPGDGYVTGTGVPISGGTGTGATFNLVGGTISSLAGTSLPYAVVKAQNRVYFSNGSVRVSYMDGEAGFKIAGDVPGACRYLVANENHLIGAVWSEPDTTQLSSTLFERRIRWSDSNNFEEWDNANPASTAGVTDLINTPDNITGLSIIGGPIYIYRDNGISRMNPTGQASQPFFISNFNIAPKGEGSPFSYTLTSHNNLDRFVGNTDVWVFDGTNFTPLMEGKCKLTFFQDLLNITGNSQVRGMITTVWDNGFPFLAYVITMPGLGISWVLNINENSWTRISWAIPAGKSVGYFDLQFIEQVYTA